MSVCALFFQIPTKLTWQTGVEALKDALRTEAKVTKSIRQVIQKCEDDSGNNDYHVCIFSLFFLPYHFLNLDFVG